MKRFIDLRGQIDVYDESHPKPDFAFYCTIVDLFEMFGGEQHWGSKADFLESVDYEERKRGVQYVERDRYLGLMPDWVPNGD